MQLYHFDKLPSNSLSNKTDSVNLVLQHMQYKIDSLEKAVNKTEIGTGFFSDVISTNLYMFATIIGLAALVSWGFIAGSLYAHKKAIEKRTNLLVNKLSNLLTKRFISLEKEFYDVAFDVNRSMYLATKNEKKYPELEFNWCIKALINLIKFPERSTFKNKLEAWINILKVTSNRITVGNKTIIRDIERIQSQFKLLEDCGYCTEEQLKKLEETKQTIMHIAYTRSNP